ncbi:ATP-binding cassette domain-containing protein [Prochlorococcus marinus XMU1412]|uniref:ABC transporter ATP-binding protein n=1 Tax=Prochlorococcus marinus TaxID=1219 RepID=UPI001AD95A9E|nr:ATP-binding cassette domain-containing protein [Prochlorococcus marinus]MBO8240518.1 ATP-binding cassette domain-containing protein [Prochlorococcus marinus XMU1412]MBW3071752.1 hypothetical protein [Prochlorococcus marinus str. MU1412]
MNDSLNNKNIFYLIGLIWKYLSSIRKRQIKLLIILVIFASISEFISIYSLVPFLAVLTNPDSFLENQIIQNIINLFDFKIGNNLLLILTVIFLVANIFSAITRIIFNYYTYRLSSLIGSDLSIIAYKYSLYRPYSYHLVTNSNKLVTIIAKNINEIISYVINPTFQLFSALVISLIMLITLLVINFSMTFNSIFIILLFYILFVKISAIKIRKLSVINAIISQNLIKLVQESIGGIRDVILSNNQEYFIKKFSVDDKTFRKEDSFGNFLSILPKLIIEPIAIIIVACSGYYLVSFANSKDAITILGALTFSGIRLLPFAQRIYEGITLPRLAKSRLVNLIEILENPPDKIRKDKKILKSIKFKKNLELRNLCFKYDKDGPLILDNVSLKIQKGEKIGFIGKTGSGKSTLLDLIMGLIEPTSGSILIDDASLFGSKSYRIKKLWQNLFMHVPQNIFLSDSSIAENIAFGFKKENIDFQKIQEVASKAQINDFIQNSFKGLNTLVGERGVRLSGGQRQRIGIARALYKNQNVIFLDEATSALDEVTENKIMNAFNYLGSEVTIIVIAHRLNTLKFCNRVFEIKDGKLIRREIFNG